MRKFAVILTVGALAMGSQAQAETFLYNVTVNFVTGGTPLPNVENTITSNSAGVYSPIYFNATDGGVPAGLNFGDEANIDGTSPGTFTGLLTIDDVANTITFSVTNPDPTRIRSSDIAFFNGSFEQTITGWTQVATWTGATIGGGTATGVDGTSVSSGTYACAATTFPDLCTSSVRTAADFNWTNGDGILGDASQIVATGSVNNEWTGDTAINLTGVGTASITGDGSYVYGTDELAVTGGAVIAGSAQGGGFTISGTLVPIPAAVWLFGSALGLLGWVRRRAMT
jgi:hypothetical protein